MNHRQLVSSRFHSHQPRRLRDSETPALNLCVSAPLRRVALKLRIPTILVLGFWIWVLGFAAQAAAQARDWPPETPPRALTAHEVTFPPYEIRTLGNGITGQDAETAGDEIGIALNKNAIPFDPLPPLKASGIRVGTPGPATLGMDEPEMKEVANILGEVLRQPQDEGVKDKARARVRDLVARFPAYA